MNDDSLHPSKPPASKEHPASDGNFVNSAHPPIHRLDESLTPEELELVFQVSKAESIVYRIISDDQREDNEPVALSLSALTLWRKQDDGRHQVGVRFKAFGSDHPSWVLDAPIHGDTIASATINDPTDLETLADAARVEFRFNIEDCLERAGKMPFVQLLHLMEAAHIGRPSTYGATLKGLFEDSTVIALDRASSNVTLTVNGTELGARLQTRCDGLTSTAFALDFDRKLNAIADGKMLPRDFLTWVLSLTHRDDPLAAAAVGKLWDSVDDLRGDVLSLAQPSNGGGGYINRPTAGRPKTDAPPADSE